MVRCYVGAYWGPRPQSTSECAGQLAVFLARLREINSTLLARWFERGGSRAEALARPVSPDRAALQAHIDAAEGDAIGAVLGLWNGLPAEAGMSVRCGVGINVPGMTANAVVLTLPPDDEAPALYQRATAARLLEATVRCWDPDWATVTAHAWRRLQHAPPDHPVAGWTTYLTGPRPVDVPAPASVQPFHSGVVITLPGGPTDTDPDAVVAVARALPAVQQRRAPDSA